MLFLHPAPQTPGASMVVALMPGVQEDRSSVAVHGPGTHSSAVTYPQSSSATARP